MARIRTVKPEFWTDEHVAECSVGARLLFIATWNFADDHGGLDRSAKQLKAQAFPYDNIDCEPLVQELLNARLLIEYEAEGKKYLHIRGFRKHQKNEKPAAARFPVYSGATDSASGVPDVSGGATATSNGSTAPSSGSSLLLGRESKGRESPQPTAEASPRGPSRRISGKKPKTALPDGFALDGELREYAETHLPQVDVAALFESFCGKARAKSWVYADWRQAWQEFCRNCAPNSGHWAQGQYPKAGAAGVRWM
jgi:hypothetical protein